MLLATARLWGSSSASLVDGRRGMPQLFISLPTHSATVFRVQPSFESSGGPTPSELSRIFPMRSHSSCAGRQSPASSSSSAP